MIYLATDSCILVVDCAAGLMNFAVASAKGDGEELTVGEVFF